MRTKLILAASFIIISSSFVLKSCSPTAPPRKTGNICKIFDEKIDWYEAARDSSQKWGVPISLMMAIMLQESAFIGDNRPPKKYILGFIPWGRASSAYGYAQALDGTWESYQRATGNSSAYRGDFEDAVDFVGWYVNKSSKIIMKPTNQAFDHYIAYHEGPSGYRSGRWRKNDWLKKIAYGVASTERQYRSQLASCRKRLDDELDSGWLWGLF